MHVLSLFPLLFPVVFCYKVNKNNDLIILAAPSVYDTKYSEKFFDLINFQIEFAKSIIGHDNVMVLSDEYTLPFLTGRSHQVRGKLRRQNLLKARLYDIRLRPFAPFFMRHESVKFIQCSLPGMSPDMARKTDYSLSKFLVDSGVQVEKLERELTLCGGDMVHNNKDTVLIDEGPLLNSRGRFPSGTVTWKLINDAFKQIVTVAMPQLKIKNKQGKQLDDMVTFIDDNVLVMAEMRDKSTSFMKTKLTRTFGDQLHIIETPVHEKDTSCGMYSALLVTERFVYVPVYGSDFDNWKMGYSTLTDGKMLQLFQMNTKKTVVPVNMPRKICKTGVTLKSLAWKVEGQMAARLKKLGKRQALRWLRLL